jgi:hypothetical protein
VNSLKNPLKTIMVTAGMTTATMIITAAITDTDTIRMELMWLTRIDGSMCLASGDVNPLI